MNIKGWSVDGDTEKPKHCSRREGGSPAGQGKHRWKDTKVYHHDDDDNNDDDDDDNDDDDNDDNDMTRNMLIIVLRVDILFQNKFEI